VSDSYLHECTIEISAPSGQHYGPKVFAVTIKPHESVEVGWLELNNWVIAPGERVTLSARGYGTLTDTVSE